MSFHSNKNARVLIVDDNPVNIKLLETMLKKQSYQVYSAENGRQACQMAKKLIPDIILLDVMMPVMNGFDACKKIKETYATKDIPIIFLTANTGAKDVLHGFQLGAVDYITKPFKYKELLARMSTHLRLKFTRDNLQKISIWDGLTKLYNRRYIHNRLVQEISEAHRHSHPLSIFMFDLDHFKQINATHGHAVGDDIFVKISAHLKKNLRLEDIIGRYGGDEFIIILPNTDQQSGRIAAQHVKERISQMQWNLNGLKVTISGGVATMQDEKCADELIAKTDALMTRAKRNGGDKILCAQPTK